MCVVSRQTSWGAGWDISQPNNANRHMREFLALRSGRSEVVFAGKAALPTFRQETHHRLVEQLRLVHWCEVSRVRDNDKPRIGHFFGVDLLQRKREEVMLTRDQARWAGDRVQPVLEIPCWDGSQ